MKAAEFVSTICRIGSMIVLMIAGVIADSEGDELRGAILICAGILGLALNDIVSELKARK